MFRVIIFYWIVGSTNPPVGPSMLVLPDVFSSQAAANAAGAAATTLSPTDTHNRAFYSTYQVA